MVGGDKCEYEGKEWSAEIKANMKVNMKVRNGRRI